MALKSYVYDFKSAMSTGSITSARALCQGAFVTEFSTTVGAILKYAPKIPHMPRKYWNSCQYSQVKLGLPLVREPCDNEGMNYRHLPLLCRCGEVPDHIDEVGFSDNHELIVHWWCSRCRKVTYAVKSLADCWRDCPNPERSLETHLAELEEYCDEDAGFLRSIGVKVT